MDTLELLCFDFVPQQEKQLLDRLFAKYVPYLIEMIVEGIVDGRQGEKLKTILPQTDLNMVRNTGFVN